ncbi:MAG: DNA alkylation repair protein [bacterium]|nr:DNA alkylation repair protein [bacterium]
MEAEKLKKELDSVGSPSDAKFLQRFFKTGKGEYGEDDVFIGIRMPVIRAHAKKYSDMELTEVEIVLHSPVHEHRMAACVIMVEKSKKLKRTPNEIKPIYDLYLGNVKKYINNWDLVDISCRDVVGRYLAERDRSMLYELAKSSNLWERRVSIISTWQFIRVSDLEDTWKISKILLHDKEDLIHKAVGWMLREAGKRDEERLKEFLDDHAHEMPRTMLRYSLEKLHEQDKKHYMRMGK